MAVRIQGFDFTDEELEAQLCRDYFKQFVLSFWETIPGAEPLKWNWHLDVFCEEIEALCLPVFRREPSEYDLVVNVSPGTSKSSLFSVLAQAWTWTRMPECRHLCFSHTDGLVLDLADRSREVICSEKYQAFFPEIELRYDRNAREDFMNTRGGERKGCTVGGKTPTGRHSHLTWGDDPLDPQEALSLAKLKTARHFVIEVIPSRKVDKANTPTAMVMQRLGLGDPTDAMLEHSRKEGARPVRHVCLPAEVPDDKTKRIVNPLRLLDRYTPEGLMDPERLSRKVLDDFKARGALYYATQFLQQPYAPEGGMFKETYFLKRVKSAPYDAKRVRYWDRAASESPGACNTAGVLIAKDSRGNFYVEDCVVGHWEPYERNQRILATAQRDRLKYGPQNDPVIWVEGEGGASGVDSFRELARTLAGFKLKEHRIAGLGKKDVRAQPWSCQLAAGNVYLCDNGASMGEGKCSWDMTAYINEHIAFPGGKLLDRVDASSGAFAVLASTRQAGTLRTLPLRKQGSKQFQRRIVICSRDALAELVIEHRTLLVVIRDPETGEEVMSSGGAALGGSAHASSTPVDVGGGDLVSLSDPLPPHALHLLVDSLCLHFIPDEPKGLQESWETLLQPWNKLPADLIMDREHAKSLWRVILKQRQQAWEVLVIADNGEGDTRAESTALSVCDVLGLPRESIYHTDTPDKLWKDVKPVNLHCYDMVKHGRGLVL